jgi:hypothetical protein
VTDSFSVGEIMQIEQHHEVPESFRCYTRAFQSRDANASAQTFHEPALLIAPHGIFALLSRAEVERTYSHVMADFGGF